MLLWNYVEKNKKKQTVLSHSLLATSLLLKFYSCINFTPYTHYLTALPLRGTYKIRDTCCHVGCAWPTFKWKVHWLWLEGAEGGEGVHGER